jgi:hypothetical protein
LIEMSWNKMHRLCYARAEEDEHRRWLMHLGGQSLTMQGKRHPAPPCQPPKKRRRDEKGNEESAAGD